MSSPLAAPTPTNSCPSAWRTWRYLQLDIQAADQPVHIASFKTWFTAYPFVEKASFTSDDNSLRSIWDTGWRTARLDAHDTYMDTPYWERLQYIGDTRLQALISYTVAGDDRLARQAIQAFNDSRIPDSLTQSRYPSSLVQKIPTFSLLWVDMVYDFWLYRGDRDFTRAQLAGTRAVSRLVSGTPAARWPAWQASVVALRRIGPGALRIRHASAEQRWRLLHYYAAIRRGSSKCGDRRNRAGRPAACKDLP